MKKFVRTVKQVRDYQLRLATIDETDQSMGVLSRGYLRVDARISPGPGFGKYFGLHFSVVIWNDQYIKLGRSSAFFYGSEEVLALNSERGDTSLVDYGVRRNSEKEPFIRDKRFPGWDFEEEISAFEDERMLTTCYAPEEDSSPIFRFNEKQMSRLWKENKISELIHIIEEDIGSLAYKARPVRKGDEKFDTYLGGFPSEFQERAIESCCFNFGIDRKTMKIKVPAARVPPVHYISVPIGGQPR